MNETGEQLTSRGDERVEALLGQAAPRQVPPADIEHDVRAAVHDEWRAVTGARNTRRRFVGFAIAATVLLAVALSFNALRVTGIAPVEVATIVKSHGSIFVQGEQSELLPAANLDAVVTGQRLATATDSAVALNWKAGGSVRLDENTRLDVVSDREIFLHSGRVYFDSTLAGADTALRISTIHGTVTHVGTQYMAESTAASLVVSVREGRVAVEGTYHDHTAVRGERVVMTGSAPAAVTNISGTGVEWAWIETVVPKVDMDGRSTLDFLQWVGRETGHELQFQSAEAEQLARDTAFVGNIEGDPRSELRLRMMTVDLDAQFDPQGPAIVVSVSR